MISVLVLAAALRGLPHIEDPVCPAELTEVRVDLSVPVKQFEGCVLNNVTVYLTRSGPVIYPVMAFVRATDSHFLLSPSVSAADFWRIAPRDALLGANVIKLY